MELKKLTAVINCPQEIPCNPCETSCRFGAITVGEDISALPVLDAEKCVGCGVCAAACPGIAIRLLGAAKEEGQATVAIPYEYLPVPDVGESVAVTDQNGTVIGWGTLQKIARPLKDDPTCLLYISTPNDIALNVYGIQRKEG